MGLSVIDPFTCFILFERIENLIITFNKQEMFPLGHWEITDKKRKMKEAFSFHEAE